MPHLIAEQFMLEPSDRNLCSNTNLSNAAIILNNVDVIIVGCVCPRKQQCVPPHHDDHVNRVVSCGWSNRAEAKQRPSTIRRLEEETLVRQAPQSRSAGIRCGIRLQPCGFTLKTMVIVVLVTVVRASSLSVTTSLKHTLRARGTHALTCSSCCERVMRSLPFKHSNLGA